MDNNLWEKVEQFLYQLHYEDTDREFHYESQAYKETLEEKERKSSAFKAVLGQLQDTDSQAVKEYLQASDQCAYEEKKKKFLKKTGILMKKTNMKKIQNSGRMNQMKKN